MQLAERTTSADVLQIEFQQAHKCHYTAYLVQQQARHDYATERLKTQERAQVLEQAAEKACLFVGSAEDSCHGSSRAASTVGQLHGRVLGIIWSLESQVTHLHKVKARAELIRAGQALRPGHGDQNGDSHGRPAKLQ